VKDVFEGLESYRDDWSMQHFLRPKLLRKARKVRVQLEDIMKFQKMQLVSVGTDFNIIRLAPVVISTFTEWN
jgi:pre-mRNA-splicing factor ATP-dependent RNA helicase DHX38/PRP16